MKKAFTLRLATVVAFSLVLGFTSQAQSLTVDSGTLPADMAQSLVGEGVEISGATISGLPIQYGLFNSDNTEMGTSSGILLSTGHAANAIGPNDDTGLPTLDGTDCLDCDLFDLDQPGDLDLSILSGGNTWDACVFEFDVVVQGDSLRFDFAFGSEEYLEWVGSSFNDVFGFFISGPGIAGTQNLAVVPGTSTPISVNSINLVDNPSYFYDNQDPLGQNVQYDGFTTGLTAEIGNLIPCETYHLKLAVADGADRLYDTGVFISKIESNPASILTSTAAGVDYMIEGCNNGTVTLETTYTPTTDLEVLFTIDGTATPGLDYTTAPDLSGLYDADLDAYVITIPAGSTTFTFQIIPLADGIIDGGEFVTVTLVEQLCDGLEFNSSVDFIIEDTFLVNVTPAAANLCFGQCVDFSGTVSDTEFADFVWEPTDGLSDPTSLDQTVCPEDDITYYLRATLGDCIAEDSIVITVDSLQLSLIPTQSSCSDQGFGSIDLTVLDGFAPYTYSWTGPNGFTSSDEDIFDLEAGEYCVSVSDDEDCMGVACVTIIVQDPLSIDAAVLSDFACDEISCAGATDGSIDLTLSGGTGVYTVDWVGPGPFTANTEDLSGLGAGTYIVTITDENGCEVTGTYVLSEPLALTIELVGAVDVLCSGESTGSATVTSTGGCPPYFYSWSHDPTLTTPIALDLPSSSYQVFVTDANGCTSTDGVTIVIAEPGDPLEITTESVLVYPGGFNVSCAGATDASVDVSLAGGIGAYTIVWTDVNGFFVTNTEDLTSVACGTYTLTVTDENGCSDSETYNLTCVPEINITYTTVTNPCGDSSAAFGEIDITSVFGGNGGPYTESWISGPSCPCAGLSLTGLESGDYIIEIADNQGCTNQFIINVGTNSVFNVTALVTDLACAGDSSGAIDITVDPLGVYNFVWTGPNGFSSIDEDLTGLHAGDYTVAVTGGGCEEEFNYTVNEPDAIQISFINIVPPLCFGVNNGSIEVQATGGTGAVDVIWLPSPDASCFFSGSSDAVINNLFECWYYAEATDASGCVVTDSIFLDAPVIMDIFVSVSEFDGGFNISCNGENDGSISVTVSGGTPDPVTYFPYDYLYDWTNGDDVTAWGNDPNADFVTNLGPGTYQVDVYDANGCLATTTIDVSEPEEIDASGGISDYNGYGVSCFGATDGFINPSIAGGSGDYDIYEWISGDLGTNDVNAENLIGLGAGEYCLHIVDSNGCEETICFTLTEPEILEGTVISTSDASCFGYCDGTASIDATGGAGGYLYNWLDDDGLPYSGNILTGLCSGTYTGTVTDINACFVDLEFEILQPDTFAVTLSVPSQSTGPFDLACVGDDNGSILSDVQGGIPNLDYLWQDCDGNFIGNAEDVADLGAGCYELIVTDDQGCEASATIDITEPDEALEANYTVSLFTGGFNISCFGACDGTLDTEVTGGVPDYTYLWHLNGEDVIFSEDDGLTDLCAGLYDVLITDSNGCDTTLFVELTEPEPIQPNVVVSDFNGFGVSCNGSCDGTISITPAGGIGDITVTWADFANEFFLEDLCAGDYLLTLSDEGGCELITVVTITEPEVLVIDTIVSTIDCNGETGSISLVVTGGVEPYTYVWTPDVGSGPDVTGLGTGSYTCVVTDANLCTAEVTVDLTEPTQIEVPGVVTDATCGLCDGAIDISPSGGTPPYTLVWDGLPGGIEDPVDLCPGTYTVTVTDSNGCELTASFDVGGPPAVTASADITHLLCYDDCIGQIVGTFGNVLTPSTYTWTDAAGDPVVDGTTASDLCAGEYTMTIDHGEGCVDIFVYTVTQPDSLWLTIESPEHDNGYNVSTFAGADGEILSEVFGGTPDYTWEWDGPMDIDDDEFNPFDLIAGTYNLTVTDFNGCVIDTVITLTEPFDLTLPTGFSPNGDNNNDSYVILGIEEHPDNIFRVYNRWGNLVYEKSGYQNEWVGDNADGDDLADGTYYVVFEADDRTFNTYVDLRR